jgi:hypothetical protein
MVDSQSRTSVSDALNSLRQLSCWSVIAGPGTGSGVLLQFGTPVPRKSPIRNPTLTEFERTHDSPYSLMISCPWRLERGKLLLSDSSDDNDADGPMLSSLSRMKDQSITSATLDWSRGDLTILFGDGLALFVMPSLSSESEGDEGDEGYDLFVPGYVLSINRGGHVEVQDRVLQAPAQT